MIKSYRLCSFKQLQTTDIYGYRQEIRTQLKADTQKMDTLIKEPNLTDTLDSK